MVIRFRFWEECNPAAPDSTAPQTHTEVTEKSLAGLVYALYGAGGGYYYRAGYFRKSLK